MPKPNLVKVRQAGRSQSFLDSVNEMAVIELHVVNIYEIRRMRNYSIYLKDKLTSEIK